MSQSMSQLFPLLLNSALSPAMKWGKNMPIYISIISSSAGFYAIPSPSKKTWTSRCWPCLRWLSRKRFPWNSEVNLRYEIHRNSSFFEAWWLIFTGLLAWFIDDRSEWIILFNETWVLLFYKVLSRHLLFFIYKCIYHTRLPGFLFYSSLEA